MKKIPISLIVDDPAPVVSVYEAHAETAFTRDGRPLVATYPNELLFRFCDVVENRGIKGKFSVVPMPANKGDIINGLDNIDKNLVDEWLDTVKKRLAPQFTIGPEILTHHKAVDLKTGSALNMNERVWSMTQNRTTLTPYIAKALCLLKEAGFDAFGVTSPWDFGIEVEDEYVAAISEAVYQVTGKKDAWYFLRSMHEEKRKNAKPWIAYEENGRTVVSIPGATRDYIWRTINTPENSDEYVRSVADLLITEDGQGGEIINILNDGGYPILLTHWQSLMSNGLGTGVRVLDEVACRVNAYLGDRVEWMSFEELMHLALSNKAAYPKPAF